MKSLQIIVSICLIVICNCGFGAKPNKQILHFNADKTFKIVQFTDIHWESGLEGNEMTTLSMEIILDKEKPDLVVLTGDIVTSGNVSKGWSEVAAPMIQRKINWVAVFGNHDSEGEMPRKKVYGIVSKLEYNLSGKTLDEISGVGNFNMSILSSNNKKSAILYFFDSHAYPEPNMPGAYDWIKNDQILWYKNISSQYTQENNNQPQPSLAFFHIPLPEYKEVRAMDKVVGHRSEEVSSPVINTGLFSAMIEKQDIMGVFTGHDHNNDFIGVLNNIALAYGRCSGNNGYGDLRLGARVIELFQDEFHFNSWIATPAKTEFQFTYPMSNLMGESTELLPAIAAVKELKQGVRYHYFEGELKSVNEIDGLDKIKSGILENISLSPAQQTDHFAFVFETCLKIPNDGIYQFYLLSDDGAILNIDDHEIINNDGGHSVRLRRGAVGLKRGYHKFELQYFEDYMGNKLEVGMSSVKSRQNKLDKSYFFIEK